MRYLIRIHKIAKFTFSLRLFSKQLHAFGVGKLIMLSIFYTNSLICTELSTQPKVLFLNVILIDPIHVAAMMKKSEAWLAELPQMCASVRKSGRNIIVTSRSCHRIIDCQHRPPLPI